MAEEPRREPLNPPRKPGWPEIILGILGIALLLALSLFIAGLGSYR